LAVQCSEGRDVPFATNALAANSAKRKTANEAVLPKSDQVL
jgi:hypothetical protein